MANGGITRDLKRELAIDIDASIAEAMSKVRSCTCKEWGKVVSSYYSVFEAFLEKDGKSSMSADFDLSKDSIGNLCLLSYQSRLGHCQSLARQ